MFRWRRRNDGFEWREYVRTTILVRRGDRRRRIDDARLSAVAGLKETGQQSASKASDAARAAGRGLKSGLGWALQELAAVPGRVAAVVQPLTAPVLAHAARAGHRLATALEPAFAFLRQREIRLPLILIGAIAAIGAAQRMLLHGYDQEVTFAGLIALAALVLTALPAYAEGRRLHLVRRARDGIEQLGFAVQRVPGLQRTSALRAGGLTVAVAGGLAIAGAWALHTTGPDAGASRLAPVAGAKGTLEGRAIAISGDSIRLAGTLVKLGGIEAPDREQTCQRPSTGRWRCGEAAKTALERLIRGNRVACVVSGGGAEPAVGACTVKGEDIAAGLVRDGHVFALSGLFAPYGSLETKARSANIGLWFGEADRPSEFRAKKWEVAKRSAPDGCPIKGQVSGRGRIYVLPWSPEYDSVKVHTAKGERWFCSEDEARAAGWKATARS